MLKRTRALFVLSSFLLVLCCMSAHATEQVAQKYPPYPDVWGIKIFLSERVDYAAIRVIKMPNGDYLITYAKDWLTVKEKAEPVNAGKLLFSGEVKDFTTDEYNDFFKLMRKEKRVMKSSPIMFGDGGTVKLVTDLDPKGDNPFDWYLEKRNKNGNILIQKIFLYIYDKSVKKKTPLAERNFDYKEKYYDEKVGWPEELKLIPLEDNTFFVVGFLKYKNPPSVILIRFDKDLKTKSALLDNEVFFFDKKMYQNLRLDDQAANEFFFKHLTNKGKEN